jgi:hypothetical protein
VKIDNEVEPVVREAFASSVAAEPDRFNNALENLGSRGDQFAREALRLALSIDAAALYVIHDGQRPNSEQLQSLAQDFTKTETWVDIAPEVPIKFLTALAEGTSVFEVLPPDDVADVTFVMGGWLLAAFLPDGKDWTDFLDEILDALEAAPTQP